MSTELTFRPERNRSVLVTIELCSNRKLSEHGALELICSLRGGGEPSFFSWPLEADSVFSSWQYTDLVTVVEKLLLETLLCTIGIQGGLEGLEP
jgi:hypothetical protein